MRKCIFLEIWELFKRSFVYSLSLLDYHIYKIKNKYVKLKKGNENIMSIKMGGPKCRFINLLLFF